MCFNLIVAQPISNHSNIKSHASYTHMIFNVTMVTLWMTLHMNNCTNFVMDDG
jgi:hypothetical protein